MIELPMITEFVLGSLIKRSYILDILHISALYHKEFDSKITLYNNSRFDRRPVLGDCLIPNLQREGATYGRAESTLLFW